MDHSTRSKEIRRACVTAYTPGRPTTFNAVCLVSYEVAPRRLTPPILLTKVEADYTEEARAARLQGTVSLEAVFDEEGYATNIRVTHALGMGLDRKAIEALQQWVFQPGTKDGKPVRVRGKIQINFRLPPKSSRD